MRLWWCLCVRLDLGGATARGGPTLLCDEGARDRRGPLAALAPLGDLGLGVGLGLGLGSGLGLGFA